MAPTYQQQLGVTGALSSNLPTEAEKDQSNALLEELRARNNFENALETQKRAVVLESLQKIVTEFVKQVGRSKNMSEAAVNQAGGRILTYGSYRLGVYGPGSDIDTLVVVPKHVTRKHYFDLFPDLLMKMAPEGAIEDLASVQDAYVPIIKFVYSGISIDLIFSHLERTQILEDISLADDSVLHGIDEFEARSLNGTRVTDDIISLVPQKGPFRTALRAIKEWAKQRAIYGNIVGFPGGVAYAMMVARVCQLYPKATASTIVLKFFKIMGAWQWPQPVLLKHIQHRGPPVPGTRIWNPTLYPSDDRHLMPIITPSYPSMCATHNITLSTKEIIRRELKKAGIVVDSIFSKKATWRDFFAKQTFFVDGYKYYLCVIASSTTKDAQKLWSGRVESKVRTLVQSVEAHASIHVAHPFNKGFKRVHKCTVDDHVEAVKAGSMDFVFTDVPTEATDLKNEPVVGDNLKEETIKQEPNNEEASKIEGGEKVTMIYTETFYIGLEMAEGAKSLDLSYEVEQFKNLTKQWEIYNAELNALNVVTVRNFDLPNDVFEEGETKPTKPPKKAKKRAAPDQTGSPSKRQQTSVAAAG